ncbi:MAG: hypothetical protein EBY83_04945 [Verrucomicrobia bacterium]|nr:hypothetical protein [Verrucomicrobiota bacterium]
MKNPSGNKLEKLVFGMFDQMVEGADKYVTKQGSTWLIFTEDKRWVIEFTNDKTLWFNYNLFQNELDLIGKDCTEERDLIKKWFESRFLNTPKVEETLDAQRISQITVERAIQNGVKETTPSGYLGSIEMKGKIVHQIESPKQNNEVEDTIQNGVKNTSAVRVPIEGWVEDTIQNGVKETQTRMWPPVGAVDETIQNGVKDIIDPFWVDPVRIKDAIQNGVKETKPSTSGSWTAIDDTIENGVKEILEERTEETWFVDEVIQDGIKETKSMCGKRGVRVDYIIQNGVKHVEDGDWLDQDERIDDIIENGVKETKEISNFDLMSEFFNVNARRAIRDGVKELKELPDKSGEFRGYGDYYHRQEDITKPHTEYVKEVIEDSYNHMGRVEGIVRIGEKLN